jgi:hypothetical protein
MANAMPFIREYKSNRRGRKGVRLCKKESEPTSHNRIALQPPCLKTCKIQLPGNHRSTADDNNNREQLHI